MRVEGPTDADLLIAKLEAAAGGSLELDRQIYKVALRDRQSPFEERRLTTDMEYVLPYTTSWADLNAALTLLPEGRLWSIGSIVNGSGFVAILNNDGRSHRGATPALALCVAALRAHN